MSVTIKDEPESIASSILPSSNHQEPTPFCALCLRMRPPGGQFYRYNPENSATFCQVMVEILGDPFWLDSFAVCRACWSMVQLIEHFRQCCFVARTWIGHYGVGVKAEADEWFAGETLERIGGLQTVIQQRTDRIGISGEPPGVDVQVASSEVLLMDQIKVESTEIEEPLMPLSELITENETKEDDLVSILSADDFVEGNIDLSNDTLECSKEEPPELDPDLRPMETEYPECLNCQEIFDTEPELQEHSKYCDVEGSVEGKKFTCPICTSSFDKFKDVAIHVRSHRDSKTNNKVLSTEKLRLIHERTNQHKSRKLYIKYQKPINTVFCCAICPAKFRSAEELMNHVDKKHPLDDEHQKHGQHVCPTCSKEFVLKSALAIHQKFSHRKPTFECQYCDKKFSKNNDLIRHLTYVHGKDAQQAKTSQQSRLRKQNESPGENSQTLYCPMCNAAFSSGSLLNKHIWLHTKHQDSSKPEKIKVYFCKLCSKSFTHEIWLRKHEELVHKV